MSLLAERAGQVVIRVGGNTQDYATLVASTPDGKMIEKESIDPNNPVSKCSFLSRVPLIQSLPDRYANDHFHRRDAVHDGEHLNFRERQVVSWWVSRLRAPAAV